MTPPLKTFALAGLTLASATAAAAADRTERWIALSNTAMSITGDIQLSPTRLRAAGKVFPLKVVRDFPAFQNDLGQRVAARVLAVSSTKDPLLRNGNRLGCGPDRPIRWIVVWRQDQGKTLGMDTFSGSQMPRSARGSGFCGSYFYTR